MSFFFVWIPIQKTVLDRGHPGQNRKKRLFSLRDMRNPIVSVFRGNPMLGFSFRIFGANFGSEHFVKDGNGHCRYGGRGFGDTGGGIRTDTNRKNLILGSDPTLTAKTPRH